MTELNDSPETAAEPPNTQWPGPGEPTGDPTVDAALGLLDGIRAAPVAGHSALYSGIHDALREALDAEPAHADPRTDDES